MRLCANLPPRSARPGARHAVPPPLRVIRGHGRLCAVPFESYTGGPQRPRPCPGPGREPRQLTLGEHPVENHRAPCPERTRPRVEGSTARPRSSPFDAGDPARPAAGTAACTGGGRCGRRVPAPPSPSSQNRRASACRKSRCVCRPCAIPQTSGTGACRRSANWSSGREVGGRHTPACSRTSTRKRACRSVKLNARTAASSSPRATMSPACDTRSGLRPAGSRAMRSRLRQAPSPGPIDARPDQVADSYDLKSKYAQERHPPEDLLRPWRQCPLPVTSLCPDVT